MIVEPEFDKGIGIRVRQIDLSEDLEGLGSSLRGRRDQAERYFSPVDVGLVFKITADAVEKRFGGEAKDSKDEQQERERGPILHATDLPLTSPARESLAYGKISDV